MFWEFLRGVATVLATMFVFAHIIVMLTVGPAAIIEGYKDAMEEWISYMKKRKAGSTGEDGDAE